MIRRVMKKYREITRVHEEYMRGWARYPRMFKVGYFGREVFKEGIPEEQEALYQHFRGNWFRRLRSRVSRFVHAWKEVARK